MHEPKIGTQKHPPAVTGKAEQGVPRLGPRHGLNLAQMRPDAQDQGQPGGKDQSAAIGDRQGQAAALFPLGRGPGHQSKGQGKAERGDAGTEKHQRPTPLGALL